MEMSTMARDKIEKNKNRSEIDALPRQETNILQVTRKNNQRVKRNFLFNLSTFQIILIVILLTTAAISIGVFIVIKYLTPKKESTKLKLEIPTMLNITEKDVISGFYDSNVQGGNNFATPNEFPFQVLILNSTGIHCGGSVLSKNFILTAAQCLYDYDAEKYKTWMIVAGDHNWQIDNGTEQKRQIRDFFIHNEYISIAEHVNDIAIIMLNQPLQLSTVVQPILLPDADYEATGNAVVTGWGKLRYEGSSNPLELQKVTVPIVDREVCRKAYERKQVLVSPFMMCAGPGDVVKGGRVDACHGNLGGPLSVQLSNGSYMLIGIVSGGIFRCGEAEYPGIYIQVSKYVDWIHDTLKNLDPEGDTRCNYANGNNASLIFSVKKDIKMFSLDGLNTTQMIQTKYNVLAIDYNFRTNTIFWFSYLDKKIYIGSMDKEVKKKSIWRGSSSLIFGIAVDWIHEHLYWVDVGRKQVAVSNFIGTMKKVLFNKGLSLPYSIAVNPLNGWMYWSDKDKHRIERAGLDGSQREVILSTNIKFPSGLVVDFVGSRLYWSQDYYSTSSIWSCEFNGSDQKLIFTANPSQFASSFFWKIATYDKYVYYTEDYGKSIYKINKCNREEFELIYKSESWLRDFKIYDATLQPEGENLCLKWIGRCSHFCFPVPSSGNGFVSTTTCACPDGLSFFADQQNCF